MYSCDFCRYYQEQQGSGLPYFQGQPFQLGYGNGLTMFFQRYGIPLAKYLGKKAMSAGREWIRDVVMHDQPAKQALKKRLVKTAQDITNEGFEKLQQRIQSGSGVRRKRSRRKLTAKPKKSSRKTKKVSKKPIKRTTKRKKPTRKTTSKRKKTVKKTPVRRRRTKKPIQMLPDIFD